MKRGRRESGVGEADAPRRGKQKQKVTRTEEGSSVFSKATRIVRSFFTPTLDDGSNNDDDGSDEEGMNDQTQRSGSQEPRARAPASNDDESSCDDMEDQDGTLDFTQPDYGTANTSSQTEEMQENESAKTKPPSVPAKIGQLSAKAIDDLTAQLVRYMLYKAGLKLPVKFADISKEVFPKHKNVSRYFFQRAKQQLENVFGYQVVAVDDNTTKEMYIILNGTSAQDHLLQVNKNGRCATRGLLMMILGLLWCAPGRQLSEDNLWKQLALLDSSIRPGKDHRQLGDVAQLIKTFENQMYLNGTSELDADLRKVKFYSYGARTNLEVGKVHILNFVCKLITGRPPTELQIEEINLESNH